MSRPAAERDEQLRADFLRLREIDGVIALEVGIVEWHGPHTPKRRWEVAHRFTSAPSPDELRSAQRAALENPRFFGVCNMCGKRCNIGHMHSETVCQGCAERHLGVVH
jgi:hypothetical protein